MHRLNTILSARTRTHTRVRLFSKTSASPPPPISPSSSSTTSTPTTTTAHSQPAVSRTDSSDSSLPSADVIISKRAIAGLSPEYRDLLLKRAERGKSLPILYSNPGAYAQLSRLSDDVIAAIPPPPRPLYPMTETQHTLRLVKGFSIGLVFVALAIYLYLKKTLRGNERFELERRFPVFAKTLEAIHMIQDLSSIREDLLDRNDLFKRLFARYSRLDTASSSTVKKKQPSSTVPTLSIDRAKYLLTMLLTLVETGQDMSEETQDVEQKKRIEQLVTLALTDSGMLTKKVSLSCEDFLQLSQALMKSTPSVLLSLASHELFGIVGVSSNSKMMENISTFFESVTLARSSGFYFSASDLIELCSDAGFSASQLAATDFIRDCAYLDLGNPIETKSTQSTSRVKVTREQFVEFILSAAYEAGVNEDRIQGFLQTYTLLHLSGMKEAAGVKRSVVLS